MASKTLGELLDAIRKEPGLDAILEGSPAATVESPAPLAEAGPDNISFFGDSKYEEHLKSSRAGCLLVAKQLAAQAVSFSGNKILVSNLPLAWARVLELWAKDLRETPWGIDPSACVARTVKLGPGVSIGALSVVEDRSIIGEGSVIGAQCYIGKDTVIGRRCILHPRVTILERCRLGDNVIIHSGAVIGSDGFGYADAEGRHHKVPQIGTVLIEDDVEIGANTTIDRAQTGATKIGAGTKIDNLVQIAHNVVIGKHCLLASQVGIAGSARLGDYVILGGQVGVRDHVEIASGTIAGGQAGIIGDVKVKDILWGTPARNHRQAMRQEALLGKLPEIYDHFKKIKKVGS